MAAWADAVEVRVARESSNEVSMLCGGCAAAVVPAHFVAVASGGGGCDVIVVVGDVDIVVGRVWGNRNGIGQGNCAPPEGRNWGPGSFVWAFVDGDGDTYHCDCWRLFFCKKKK